MNMHTHLSILLLASALAFPCRAGAVDLQLHGFAAQGFVLSSGNNLYGHSLHGSVAYHEVGVNGTLDAGHGLILSAQALERDAGQTDNGHLRLDYALLDWRFIQETAGSAGVRLGRVKNPFGFYNDTRDLVFTRPGILLPQSVYFDTLGLRSALFTSDGGQLYGNVVLGDHDLSAAVSLSAARDASDEERRQFGSGMLTPSNVHFRPMLFARVSDDIDGGTLQLAASFAHATLEFEADSPYPMDADLRSHLYVLSARYNAPRWNLTAEYSLTQTHYRTSLTGELHNTSDGLYVQAGFIIDPHWTAYARYDGSFADRTDRDGRDQDANAAFRTSRYAAFAHDGVLGVSWKPDEHWGIWAEHHWVYGTSTVSTLDNQGRQPDPHWTAFLLMAAYRF